MDLREARALCMDLMEQHGIDEHNFEWIDRRGSNRLGEAEFHKINGITLRLNRSVTRHNDRDAVEQTILHEIAHILVGVKHHHDAVWRMKAYSIGYRGSRTSTLPDEHHLTRAWIGECPNGHLSSRSRAPRPGRIASCSKCSRRFNPAYVITWRRNDGTIAAQRGQR